MFAPYCSNCRSTILLGPRRIVDVQSTPSGHRVQLRCLCGQLVSTEVESSARDQVRLRGAA